MGTKSNRALAAIVSLAAAAATPHPLAGQGLREGTWIGVTQVRNVPPVGSIFTVSRRGGPLAISITTLSCGQGCQLGNPRLAGDTLSFSWTAPAGPVPCRLTRQRDRSFRGTCLAGRDTIHMSMDQPGDTWEPFGLARYLLDAPQAEWRERSAGAVRVYAPRGSRTAGRLDSLAREARVQIEDGVKALRLPGAFTDPTDIFLVDSRADIERWLGVSVAGYTDPVSRTIVLVVDSVGGTPLRHELAHIVSWHAWGGPGPLNDWMQEGFAVFFDWRPCREGDLYALAGYLEQEGRLVTTEALVGGFRDFDTSITYIQSGALVRFLFERYGVDRFRDLWHRGIDELQYVTGATLPQVDATWRAWILDHARDPAPGWERLIEMGCR